MTVNTQVRWGPLTWRHLDADQAGDLWDELVDWVEWLRRRYGLSHSKLPGCWPNHPVAVEELTALMGSYTAAYQALSTKDGVVVRYHDTMIVWHRLELWSCLSRLKEHASFGDCNSKDCNWYERELKPLHPSTQQTINADIEARRAVPAQHHTMTERAMAELVASGDAISADDGSIHYRDGRWVYNDATREFDCAS